MCRSIEGGVFRASLNGTHFLLTPNERNVIMALIKCPECGRENVSDTAESCPTCGYGIKAHFERIKKQQIAQESQRQQRERQEREKRLRQAEEEQKYKEYAYEVKSEQQKIDSTKKPKKPNYFAYLFSKDVRVLTLLIVVGPLLTLLFCVAAQIDAFILVLYAAVGLLASPFWLIWAYIAHRDDVKAYKKELELYNNNRDAWEKQKEQQKADIENRYRARAHFEVENKYNPPVPKTSNQLKCPICGSTNVEKISTMDRSVSVAMVGLASGKIGKQYKCKKCKHMW